MKIPSDTTKSRNYCQIIILVTLFATLYSENLYAKILTVDNTIPRTGQYATLQEAHDAASNGDTICVYPSNAPYDAIDNFKEICYIGTGFKSPQVGLKNTILKGIFHFGIGSDRSILTGFGGMFEIEIDANQISIIKNHLDWIQVSENHSGTAIFQNIINCGVDSFSIDIKSYNEVLISNNLISSFWYWSNSCYKGKGIKANNLTNTSYIFNNVIKVPTGASAPCSDENIIMNIENSNSLIFNNIFYGGVISGIQNGFYNNLCYETNLELGNGNLKIQDPNTCFVDYWSDFHLKPGSPAIGAGLNGVDMGVYGGETPFNDSGYPDIPAIYYLDVPFVGSQKEGINVTIKVKSNN